MGKGVKLGEADKAVLLWRLPDGKQCRVVFGDLSVRNMSVESEEFKAVQAEYQARACKLDQERGYLGVDLDTTPDRCEIRKVLPGTAAEKAGLKAGDFITRFDGQAIRGGELFERIGKKKAGDTVTIEVQRGDQTLKVDAVLGRRPG